MAEVLGIHHMSAVSGPGQENVDFYSGVLGLRLVKLTVNFDDPGAYHLYYGDADGNPGTLVTFFPYPNGHPGRPGAGQATVTHLSIPQGATGFWVDRFRKFEVDFDRPYSRENSETIRFRGPDGLLLELIAGPLHLPVHRWPGASIPQEASIGRIMTITLIERKLEPTQTILQDVLGFKLISEKHGRFRFGVGAGGPGEVVEIIVDPDGPASRPGHGSIHHIAFRVASIADQAVVANLATEKGLRVSQVMDRDYFKSVYFREPGGVLFEVATDGPGFTIDEPFETLGRRLMLPKRLEPGRLQIERALPNLELNREYR